MKKPTKKLYNYTVIFEVRVPIWAENENEAIDKSYEVDLNQHDFDVMNVEVDDSQYREEDYIPDEYEYDKADQE